jgi:hypothetical protein
MSLLPSSILFDTPRGGAFVKKNSRNFEPKGKDYEVKASVTASRKRLPHAHLTSFSCKIESKSTQYRTVELKER